MERYRQVGGKYAGMESDPDGLWVKVEDADALRARLAEVERERDVLRLSVASFSLRTTLLERERDEARRMLTAHNCVCDDPPRCPVFDERDDARRVAKRLAGAVDAHGKQQGYAFFSASLSAALDTANAYEVEP